MKTDFTIFEFSFNLYISNITSVVRSILLLSYFFWKEFIELSSCRYSKSKVSVFWLLNSPLIEASTGTAFLTVPPLIIPTLNVVSSSRRPWGSSFISSVAIFIADNPFSGSTPAWAPIPVIVISNLIYVGLIPVTVLTGPFPSKTNDSLELIKE